MGIQKGVWDCRYCGKKGIPGPETDCTGCGSPRDPDVDFYLPEDAEYITDEKEIEEAEAGPNWTCAYCGSDNRAVEDRCPSCGNTRSDSDRMREVKEYDEEDVPHTEEDTRETEPSIPGESAREARGTSPKKPGLGCGITGAAILTAIIALLIFLFWPRQVNVSVISRNWERTIDIEHFTPVRESGWSLPANARLIREFQDIHHYDKVLDHYETRTKQVKVKVGEEQYVCGKIDMGNGYFKDKYCTRPVYENREETYQEPVYTKVPVYRTRYEYNVKRWKLERVSRAGGKNNPPKWPEGPPSGNEWREGERKETYTFELQDPEQKTHELEVDFNTWQKYEKGDSIPAKKNRMGKLEIDPSPPSQ